jgi:hypothetical protein
MLTVRDVYILAASLIGDKIDHTTGRSNMTVHDVYVIAAAFIGDRENDDKDERDFAPIYMKVLLQEALPAENLIRISEGMEELDQAPTPGIDEVVPYSDKIVRGALPYGLAWQYHQDAGNNQLAAAYRNMFIEGVENARKSKINLAISHMNILLQEALNAENSTRAMHREPLLGAAPLVEDIDNGLVYHDDLVRGAFPYGLAWQIHQDAGNNDLAAMYRELFVNAVNGSYKYVIVRSTR